MKKKRLVVKCYEERLSREGKTRLVPVGEPRRFEFNPCVVGQTFPVLVTDSGVDLGPIFRARKSGTVSMGKGDL